MRPLRALAKILVEALRTNRDLGLFWWATVVLQPVLPNGHFLSRPDLVPWMVSVLHRSSSLLMGG